MRRAVCSLALVALLVGVPSASALSENPPPLPTLGEIGTSHDGRAIMEARRCGPGETTVEVLVVGAIHGNETAGIPVVQRLSRQTPPRGTCWSLVTALNPDGVARMTRQNARGVDLNRNFPFQWKGGGTAFDTFYPGRARASERETAAALADIRATRPDVTIWYHQHRDMVVRPPLPWRQALAGAYARVSGLAMRIYPGGPLYGTASSWQHAEQPSSLALVVELPAGPLSASALARHATAVRTVGTLARFDRPDQ